MAGAAAAVRSAAVVETATAAESASTSDLTAVVAESAVAESGWEPGAGGSGAAIFNFFILIGIFHVRAVVGPAVRGTVCGAIGVGSC